MMRILLHLIVHHVMMMDENDDDIAHVNSHVFLQH